MPVEQHGERGSEPASQLQLGVKITLPILSFFLTIISTLEGEQEDVDFTLASGSKEEVQV